MATNSLGRKRDPNATRERVLAAALKHFGEYGYEGASIRNILADADVSLSAVNYHFGSKEGLLAATIEHYVVKTYPRRLRLLDEAEKAPAGRKRLRAVAEAYVRPHIEMVIDGGEHDYGRFVFRFWSEGGANFGEAVDEALLPIRQRLHAILRENCPDVPEETLRQGIGFIVAVLAFAPFRLGDSLGFAPTFRTEPAGQVVQEAARFAYGGLLQLFGYSDDI